MYTEAQVGYIHHTCPLVAPVAWLPATHNVAVTAKRQTTLTSKHVLQLLVCPTHDCLGVCWWDWCVCNAYKHLVNATTRSAARPALFAARQRVGDQRANLISWSTTAAQPVWLLLLWHLCWLDVSAQQPAVLSGLSAHCLSCYLRAACASLCCEGGWMCVCNAAAADTFINSAGAGRVLFLASDCCMQALLASRQMWPAEHCM